MTLTQIKPAGLSKPVDLADNEQIRLGTGNDILIFHDGSNSFIRNSTGGLDLNSDTIHLRNEANSETYARFLANGAAELYYDNSGPKLATTAAGVNLGGSTCTFNDNGKLALGTGSDLQIYHNGSHSYLEDSGTGRLIVKTNYFEVDNAAGNEAMIEAVENAAVSLYYNGNKKFGTQDNGFEALGGSFTFYGQEGGGSQLLIYADEGDDLNDRWRVMAGGSNDFVIGNLADASWDTNIKAYGDGAVELYYDNSLKLYTMSSGVTVSGDLLSSSNVKVNDNGNLIAGSGNDLQIYHDGSHSNIKNNTGNLRLQCDAFRLNSADNSENIIKANKDGAVELYHDNTVRFQTLSNGCEVLGRLGVGDGTNPETTFQVTATAAGATYPVLLKNRTNGDAAIGIRFIASGADLSDGDFASIEAGHGAVNTTNHEFRFKTCSGGTVAEKLRIQAGGGISFNGDSAAANALDDYEEGTWTPSYASGSGTISVSGYSLQAGKYTKVGNLVYVEGVLRGNVTNQSTGTFDLDGLPFTIDSNSDGCVFTCWNQASWATSAPHQFSGMADTTKARARAGIDVGDSGYTNGASDAFASGNVNYNRTYFAGCYRV